LNIAITTDGQTLDSQVSEKFELCLYMLIVNMDDLSITVIDKDKFAGTSLEENLAHEVLEYNCEAVITGNINQTAFDILADAYVTRYYGVGHSAKDALELSEKQSLKLIKEECTSHLH